MAPRSEPRRAAAWVGLFLLATGPAAAQTRTWTVGACKLSIPSSWTVTGGHAAGPGGSADLDEVDNGQASLGMETILPGNSVTHQDGDRTVLENPGLGLVNAVAPVQPDRACHAAFRVSSSAGASAANAAARTLTRR